MAGYSSATPGVPTIISVTTALNFGAGVPGVAGVASDTILCGVKIRANGTSATLTITSGFRSDVAANDTTHYVFDGSTTQDMWWPLWWLNSGGGLTVVASVAYMCIVETIASTFLI
jgi:hypothetical protein